MRLPRPPIPLAVKLAVAERMIAERRAAGQADIAFVKSGSGYKLLYDLLGELFPPWGINTPLHLDHDPALCNRKFSDRTGKYKPDANDPKFLVYRTKADHDIKTRVRGDGAQLSDLAMLRKNKRIAKRIKAGKRPKYGVRT